MIVEVITGTDEVPGVEVKDVDDLARLHVAVGAVTDEEADAALRSAGLGRLADDTAWLDVAALRSAAEPQASAEGWAKEWDGMVEQARTNGWASEDGASLKAHVEPAAGA
jgi:glucan phosphorylase